MPNRDVPLLRVLLAFLIATFLLITGFLIGYGVSFYQYQDVALQQESIRYDLLSIDLQGQMVDSCERVILSGISSELDEMGSRIGILEERLGKNHENVLDQKGRYTLLEVQHFLNIKEYNKECGENINTILFFYSNSDDFKEGAGRIGFILSNIKRKDISNIMVYSFDYNLDTQMIKVLKEIYGITSPNTIVINEEHNIVEVGSADDVEKHLV
ncbi:MAG: hypothetical protein WDZ69_02305 [Candidatus Pacearchaeota archaeon]